MSAAPETSSKSCARCRGAKYVIERQGDRARAKVCECARPCPRCDGLGYVYTKREETFSDKVGAREYEVVSDCECRVRERRIAWYNDARLPGVVAHATFEGYRPAVPEQDRARKVAQAFALGYRKGQTSKGFILSGPVGAGKTHLMAAALTHLLLEKGVRAGYVEISLLYAQIRRGFQEGKSGGEIIGPLSELDVLAIDELGKGRGSPFEEATLDELIARRYNAGRTTLLATNYSLDPGDGRTPAPVRSAPQGYRSSQEHKAQKESMLLREQVGERIYSRLCEMCEFVQLPPSAPDGRRTRHEMR